MNWRWALAAAFAVVVATALSALAAWSLARRERPTAVARVLVGVPFPRTRAAREAGGDPRRSIEERYRGVDDYVQRVRAAALELIRGRYLLEEDLDAVLARARSHRDYATGSTR